jgi:predicted PhzF superfamily epimerase YddE/YHI9
MELQVDILNVFTGTDGRGGNPLGVILDGPAVPEDERQALAGELGFSETIFVDPGDRVAIYTPAVELPFAGHPLVGAAYLLDEVSTLHPPCGTVVVRYDGEEVHVTGRPEWAPQYVQVQYDTPAEVDALTSAPEGHDLVTAWSWIDEPNGLVRARVFPVGIGIPEDEATGANAVIMGAALGRPLTILQGAGSRIRATPKADGSVEIGGLVSFVERRTLVTA